MSSLKGRLGWQGLTAEEYRADGPHVVSSAHFIDSGIDWDACPRVSQERYNADSNIQLRAGDVLLMKDGAALGKLAYVDRLPGPACLNSHLLLFRPRDDAYVPRYLFYVLTTAFFQGYIGVHGTGATFLGVSQESIGNFVLALPSIEVQRRITHVLDLKTAAIDELIAKKERLIALLVEKRQALITQAVTKGLDPNVLMKDSGQTALPSVPVHWRVLPLRHLLGFGPKNGISPPPSDSGGALSFSIAAVREGRVRIDGHEKYVDLDIRVRPNFEVHSGDILLMRGSGNLELVGTCGLVDDIPAGCTYPDILMRMRPDDTTRADFLVAAVNSPYVRGQIETAAKTSNGTYKVSGEDIRALIVAAPPRSEQDRIMNDLRAPLNRLSLAEDIGKRSIDVLREHRQALITAAVTGKIDVQEAETHADRVLDEVAESA